MEEGQLIRKVYIFIYSILFAFLVRENCRYRSEKGGNTFGLSHKGTISIFSRFFLQPLLAADSFFPPFFRLQSQDWFFSSEKWGKGKGGAINFQANFLGEATATSDFPFTKKKNATDDLLGSDFYSWNFFFPNSQLEKINQSHLSLTPLQTLQLPLLSYHATSTLRHSSVFCCYTHTLLSQKNGAQKNKCNNTHFKNKKPSRTIYNTLHYFGIGCFLAKMSTRTNNKNTQASKRLVFKEDAAPTTEKCHHCARQ